MASSSGGEGLRGGPRGLLLQSQLRPAQASHAISGWGPKVQLRVDHRTRKSIAMGYQNEHVMIPVRFMVTVGHLLAIIMCFSFKDHAIYAGLGTSPSDAQYATAEKNLEAALIVALSCFVVDFIGILSGISIFFQKVNVIHIVGHFFGGIYVAWFICHQWAYQKMWYIVLLCNLIPTACDLWLIFAVFVLQIIIF